MCGWDGEKEKRPEPERETVFFHQRKPSTCLKAILSHCRGRDLNLLRCVTMLQMFVTYLLPSLEPAPPCDTLGCDQVAVQLHLDGRRPKVAHSLSAESCQELGILITGPMSRRRQCLARRQRPPSLPWRPGRQWWMRLPRLRRCA